MLMLESSMGSDASRPRSSCWRVSLSTLMMGRLLMLNYLKAVHATESVRATGIAPQCRLHHDMTSYEGAHHNLTVTTWHTIIFRSEYDDVSMHRRRAGLSCCPPL